MTRPALRLRGRSAALALTALATALAGCAGTPTALTADPAWPPADVLMLGEQHDAAAHQTLAADTVQRLASQGRLAALTMEMAERGRATAGLPRDASEATVRETLAWDDRGWPWAAYGPIVMKAVQAGVPVVGANLPRTQLRAAMGDAAIDAKVPASVRDQLETDVRDGHCGLLPASQLPAMTRVQIGRDRAMAETLAAEAQPGRVTMMVAGANHVDATRGVPQHLASIAPTLRVRTVRMAAGARPGEAQAGFDEVWPTPALPPGKDPCEGLARRLPPKAAP